MNTVKKVWLAGIVVIVIMVGTLLTLSRYGGVVESNAGAYSSDGVYVQLYTGAETPTTRWAVVGVSDRNVRLVLDSGKAGRNFITFSSCSAIRNDVSFDIRIDRKRWGTIYLPSKRLEISVEQDDLSVYDASNANDLIARCNSQLAVRQ